MTREIHEKRNEIKPVAIRSDCEGDDDDDVELNVLGCQLHILETNCDQCVYIVQCCFTPTEVIIKAH